MYSMKCILLQIYQLSLPVTYNYILEKGQGYF